MWLHGRSEAFRVAYPELRCVAMATFSLGYLYPNVNYIRDDFNLTLISIASNIRKHIHIHIYTYTHHHPAEWTFRALFFDVVFNFIFINLINHLQRRKCDIGRNEKLNIIIIIIRIFVFPIRGMSKIDGMRDDTFSVNLSRNLCCHSDVRV